MIFNDQEITIRKGDILTGIHALSGGTGLSTQNIRTGLKTLVNVAFLTIKSTNKFSIISLLKYEIYQTKSTSKLTNKQQTSNKRATTNNNVNNDDNDNNTTAPAGGRDYVPKTPIQFVVSAYKLLLDVKLEDREWDQENFSRCSKAAASLLKAFNGDHEAAINWMQQDVAKLKSDSLDWTLETLSKRAWRTRGQRYGNNRNTVDTGKKA